MPTNYTAETAAPVVSSASGGSAAAISLVPAVGDLMLIFGSSLSDYFTLDPSWTWIVDTREAPFNYTTDIVCVGYRIAESAGSVYVGGSFTQLCGVVIQKGTFDTDALDAVSMLATAVQVTSAAEPDPPSITTPVPNCLVLALGFWSFGGVATVCDVTPPAGYTEAAENITSPPGEATELSLAYKVVTAAGAEDPDAFGQTATPTSTTALTLIVRPLGIRDLAIPTIGEARNETLCSPPWEAAADLEKTCHDRIRKPYSSEGSGAPLVRLPLTAGSATRLINTGNVLAGERTTPTYESSADDVYVDVTDCTVGDRIFVEIAGTYYLDGDETDWPADIANRWWELAIQCADRAGVTAPLENTFYGPQYAIPYPIQRTMPFRLVGVWSVTASGTTRIELIADVHDVGTNHLEIHNLSIRAIHFASA